MKKLSKFFGVMLIAILSTSLWGCSKQAASATTSGTKTAQTTAAVTKAAATTAATTDKAKGTIVVGFSQVGAESDWRAANTTSIKEAGTVDKGIELIFSDAQQKQENQIKAIRSFISQEVDVIAFAPVVETGWETVLGEAKDAKIPVIIVDRMVDVSDQSLYACWIGADFKKEGYNAVDWLTKYMDTLGRGKENLNVAVLQGTIGASAEIGRTQGVREKLKDKPNYKIVLEQTGEFTRAKGQEVMESFLKSGEDIDILISQNDDMALGAIDAIKSAGKDPGKDIVIVSFDAVKTAFQAMIDGDLNCTVECNPLSGKTVMETAKKLAAGQTVEKKVYVEEGVYPADTAAKTIGSRTY
jgi:simple sugar transport system substrate-binding protein